MRRKARIETTTAVMETVTPQRAMDAAPSLDGQVPMCAVRVPPAPEAIRRRAYEKWEKAGRPAGDGVAFWLAAERELAQTP